MNKACLKYQYWARLSRTISWPWHIDYARRYLWPLAATVALFSSFAFFPPLTLAASFDCKKAFTLVEKQICFDPSLSTLDEQLATAYQKVLVLATDKDALKHQQREWLAKTRDQCMDQACLKTAYDQRLVQLTPPKQNDNNWRTNPEIKKIEALRNEIYAVEKAGNLKEESRKCVHDTLVETEGALYRDRSGKVRKYIVDVVNKNSVGRAEYYYDHNGVPRLTYRVRGEFYGEKNEERIYFDRKGQHLHTDSVFRRQDYLDAKLEDTVENPTAHYSDICNKYTHN